MCSLAELGVEVLLLGDYWRPDCDERTEIGWLVHRAKDQADDAAAEALAERFAGLAEALADTPDGSERLVVPVPSKPMLAGESDRPHLATCWPSSLPVLLFGRVSRRPWPRLARGSTGRASW